MDGRNEFQRLDLDDKLVRDEDIDPVANLGHLHPVVYQRNGYFGLHLESCLAQLVDQAGRVCAFEQAWAQGGVDTEGSIEGLLCQRIQLVRRQGATS